MAQLSSRERLVRVCLNQAVDRGVFFSEHYWSQTWERWLGEGMPSGFQFDYDFNFHSSCLGALGINIGFQPGFDIEVLQDDGATQVVRDQYGVVKRVFRDRPGQLQQFLEHPVSDRASWERLAPRLAASGDLSDRLPPDWTTRAARLNASDQIDAEIERVRPAYELGGYLPCVDHSVPPDVSWDNFRYYLDRKRELVGKA